jgi:hypothetical protein
MAQIDVVTEQFIAEALGQNTNRYIASVLSDIEGHIGQRDERISRIVKDTANAAKRIMYTRITATEVESRAGTNRL